MLAIMMVLQYSDSMRHRLKGQYRGIASLYYQV